MAKRFPGAIENASEDLLLLLFNRHGHEFVIAMLQA
jgi:hypothetical protein